jgi:LacI family transcriptional regulator
MKKRRRVALPISPGWRESELIMHGILTYARTHGNWILDMIPENFPESLRPLLHWKGDGVIASVKTLQEVEIARQLDIPVVGLSGALKEGLLPRVLTDNNELGRMGAIHLLDCGFRHLAFVGRHGADDVVNRRAGFQKQADTLNAEVKTFMTPSLITGTWKSWNAATQRLEGFLRELTLPVGIMACDDTRARMVHEACHSAGLRVPDDVAIIGVGDNRPVCEFCDTPLSSIQRPNEEMGYEAAGMLDRMMKGHAAPPCDILLPPLSIIKRKSTEVLGTRDPHVREAIIYMTKHLQNSIGTREIAEELGVSRRTLEMHFQAALRCSVHKKLIDLRLQKVETLLCTTSQKIEDIAAFTGFCHAPHLCHIFKDAYGQAPSAYRKAHASMRDTK